jgi:zinc protease
MPGLLRSLLLPCLLLLLAAGPALAARPPDLPREPGFSRVELSNGAPVFFAEAHEIPLLRIQVALLLPEALLDPRRLGGVDLLASLLDAPDPALADRLARVGGLASFRREGALLRASVETPSEASHDALEVLREMLLAPRFPRDATHRARREALARFDGWTRNPLSLLRLADREAAWGEHAILGVRERRRDLARLGPADLRRLHAEVLETSSLRILALGDAEPASLIKALEASFSRIGRPGSPAPLRPPRPKRTRVILVDLPERGLARLHLSLPPVTLQDPRFPALLLLEALLASSPSARLNRALRGDLGISYGVQADLERWPGVARLRVWSAVETAHVEEALSAMRGVLREIRDEGPAGTPLQEGELEAARRALFREDTRRLDTLLGRADLASEGLLLGDDPALLPQIHTSIAGLGLEEVQRAVRELLDEQGLTWILTGDRAVLEGAAERVGLFPTDLWSAERVVIGRR